MEIGSVLTDILIVLVAAKVAAELAERLGIPAVVGEIVAGVLVGPSVLGMVGADDEVLRTLGELGVIILLLQVGMEMDIAELGKVGRTSMLVAIMGVVAPMALGFGAMSLLGEDFNTSLFIGAALTATSVGITARVFGDLRALATTEARIVLGAAVADDVMGLVVLTVVVRLVTEGSVSALSVAGIIAVAVGFLLVSGLAGLRISGPLFTAVDRLSRSTGTLVALALAFTLGFALLADAAQLAPIVGAFVAGLALTRSHQADRIQRELAPVGHLLIPVFFLHIGIDAEVSAFADATVLRNAGLLLVVAVIGKLVAAGGAVGSPGDKMLIGLGMLPRGEVGLIFATIGLSNGVLGDELYASLLLVVLATTLVTPYLLKLRYSRLRAGAQPAVAAVQARPPGGWLVVGEGTVELAAMPGDDVALSVALDAALIVSRNEPGGELLSWLASRPESAYRWRGSVLDDLLDVIERGNPRSWRFLETTGVLAAALPELADALRARQADPFTLDLLGPYRFVGFERLRGLDPGDPLAVEADRVVHRERLLLALLLVEATDSVGRRDAVADAVVRRLGLDAETRAAIVALLRDRGLLWAAAVRAGGLGEDAVLPLASHLDTPDRARTLYVLSALVETERASWEQARLRDLHDLVQNALAHDELTGVEARNLLGRRRTQALAMARDDEAVRDRIARAPRPYVLRQSAAAIARHAELFTPPLRGHDVHVRATAAGGDAWWVDVAARDRHGLLAAVTGVLAAHELDVAEAIVATWADGVALESFRVRSAAKPDTERLGSAIHAAFSSELSAAPVPDAVVTFDRLASPWHTVCEVQAPDRPELLHVIATALAAAGTEVVAATIGGVEGEADDRFELVDTDGRKLNGEAEDAVRRYLLHGVATKRTWRRGRVYEPATAAVTAV